uniref:Uncharacterized protein n=1 Tax=Helianthus annuus TaxID=4232 RepID=A0A251SCQ7_HELAN
MVGLDALFLIRPRRLQTCVIFVMFVYHVMLIYVTTRDSKVFPIHITDFTI